MKFSLAGPRRRYKSCKREREDVHKAQEEERHRTYNITCMRYTVRYIKCMLKRERKREQETGCYWSRVYAIFACDGTDVTVLCPGRRGGRCRSKDKKDTVLPLYVCVYACNRTRRAHVREYLCAPTHSHT